MNNAELKKLLEQVTYGAARSSEVSQLGSELVGEAREFIVAANERFEQASTALKSLRLIRFFRLCREHQKLMARARETAERARVLMEDSRGQLSGAKKLFERAAKEMGG